VDTAPGQLSPGSSPFNNGSGSLAAHRGNLGGPGALGLAEGPSLGGLASTTGPAHAAWSELVGCSDVDEEVNGGDEASQLQQRRQEDELVGCDDHDRITDATPGIGPLFSSEGQGVPRGCAAAADAYSRSLVADQGLRDSADLLLQATIERAVGRGAPNCGHSGGGDGSGADRDCPVSNRRWSPGASVWMARHQSVPGRLHECTGVMPSSFTSC
jgi:hypothetical protein